MIKDEIRASDHTLKCMISDTTNSGGLPVAMETFSKLRNRIAMAESAAKEAKGAASSAILGQKRKPRITIPKPVSNSLLAAGLLTRV